MGQLHDSCATGLPKGAILKASEDHLAGASRTQAGPDTASRPTSSAAPRRLMRETALEELRQAIASGALKPGSRLTEKSLCAQFGVSRTLAREIVRKLETERLVDVVPHRGLRIAILTPNAVQEIYDIRTELEVMVVRAFITTAKDQDIAALKAIHAALLAAASRRDTPEIVIQVTRFLRHMIEVSGSKVAGELLDHLLARINMLRVYAMATPGQLETSVIQMDMIVDSIEKHDSASAVAGVRLYVQSACRAALRQLSQDIGSD